MNYLGEFKFNSQPNFLFRGQTLNYQSLFHIKREG
jgi:hypothetical protein